MWGCFLMSGVKILHFLKDWWKSISIHQNYTVDFFAPILMGTMLMFEIDHVSEDPPMLISSTFHNLKGFPGGLVQFLDSSVEIAKHNFWKYTLVIKYIKIIFIVPK